MTLVARTTSDPAKATAAIRNQVLALDPDQPVFDIKTMAQRISKSVAVNRFIMLMLGVFATSSMLLAAVGIYGLIAYTVSQRTHEIGVRVALGADATDIMKLVLSHGLKLVVAGVGMGVAGSLALTRLMESLLFQVSPTDALTFAVISSILALVALVACFVPARRATKSIRCRAAVGNDPITIADCGLIRWFFRSVINNERGERWYFDSRSSLCGAYDAQAEALHVIAVVAWLGIGANTAVFSVVNAVLLNSLPYREPARITLLWGKNPQLQLSMTDFPISYGDFVDLRDQSQSFENLSALYPDSMNLTGVVDPEHLGGASVSANFFQMLGIAPALGRSFLPEEEQPGNEHVVILSQRLWQRRFGSDSNLVGKTIQLNGKSHTVIGIMPAV
jgi:hypothetical protein